MRPGSLPTLKRSSLPRPARLGLVAVQERRQPGARSLPNVIRIISAEWRSWIERGRKGGGFKNVNPTDRLCFTRGLRNNDVRANAGKTWQPHDRGSDRTHRLD